MYQGAPKSWNWSLRTILPLKRYIVRRWVIRKLPRNLYAAFALTGNSAGTGSPDIPPAIISDEGNSDFLRLYWNMQELTTDEAAWTWQNDGSIKGLHELNWSAINPIISGLYYRSFFQITLCNDFIRQSADATLDSKGFSSADVEKIKKYRTEARFLRAYQYWVLMDCFANPPFVTENDAIGSGIPAQIQRKDLFTYIESELKAIESELAPAKSNEYGRADQQLHGSIWQGCILNSGIYTGGAANYTESITYCNKIIAAGYTLHPIYRELTIADNHLNTDEIYSRLPMTALIRKTGAALLILHMALLLFQVLFQVRAATGVVCVLHKIL